MRYLVIEESSEPGRVRSLECFGRCRTRSGRRRRTRHAIVDVLCDGVRTQRTTCLTCLDISVMDPETCNVLHVLGGAATH